MGDRTSSELRDLESEVRVLLGTIYEIRHNALRWDDGSINERDQRRIASAIEAFVAEAKLTGWLPEQPKIKAVA